MRKFLVIHLIIIFSSLEQVTAQETNSRASGRVYSDVNDNLAGITVTLIHEPTQNKYVDVTRTDGHFYFFNIKPGGPYHLILSAAGYETTVIQDLFTHLGGNHFLSNNEETTDFQLKKSIVTLQDIVIRQPTKNWIKNGLETNINSTILKSIPSISRNFQDILRLVPQAKVTGDGVMSLAGQNNRYNAFFIDGTNNTDIQGLAVNGMNGGRTGAPSISLEAIEEVNVLLSPFDVQSGNFTGGSINAITRSGTNKFKSSAWYYFSNENLAGRSPVPVPKNDSSGEMYRPRLSDFFNQTFGVWNCGPLVKNKLFYFFLFEKQSESKPQPFNAAEYRGSSNQEKLNAFSEFLKNEYQYDPGSFMETTDKLDATRALLKIDWYASTNDKLMFQYRYNNAEATNVRFPGSATSIVFQNNGFILPSITHSAVGEWNHFFSPQMNNRLLISFSDQSDKRKWIGQPFPNLLIFDGAGTIYAGSDANTGSNSFKATNVNASDVLKLIRLKSIYTLGMEVDFASFKNTYLPGYFGVYNFRNLADFMNQKVPTRFQNSFPQESIAPDATYYQTLRTSLFANDNFQLTKDLTINFGLRLDMNAVLSRPNTDKFFNDSAIDKISQYYKLDGARSGRTMDPSWTLSPRISVEQRISKMKLNIKAGAGIFVGHFINFWHSDVFNSVAGSMNVLPQAYGIGFNPDPYNQPTPSTLNLNPGDYKGPLNLISNQLKYPSVFKSSIAIQKSWKKNWSLTLEGILTKNLNEIAFRNVNIVPPLFQSPLPDSRNVYSTGPVPNRIPLKADGTNPYTQVYLLSNNHEKKGNAYNLSVILQKLSDNFSFNGSYTYGRSWLLFEVAGPQTPIGSQWRNLETVNGRNYPTISTSDNDLRHRIAIWVSKKFTYAENKASTSVSLFYNGQSGTPYSYVYGNSLINDNGRNGENFDLMYVPTKADLEKMNFVPIVDNASGVILYTEEQQKTFLNSFIENDNYLQNRRGAFAERNASRLPFTHIVDIRIQQDFIVNTRNHSIGLTITLDIFNFTNLLNKDWGRIYFMNNDSYPLVQFAGFADPSAVTPQYQSKPFQGNPYTLQSSSVPGNSARWVSQLGIKINLN